MNKCELSHTDETYIALEGNERQQERLRKAAMDWDTVFCESLAVDAVASAS